MAPMFGRFSTMIRTDGAFSRTIRKSVAKSCPNASNLTINASSLIGSAGAAAERRDNRIDVVRAREYHHEGCFFGNEGAAC